MIRIYDRFSEAFEHISWKGVGAHDSHLVTFEKDELAEREKSRLKFFRGFAEDKFKGIHLDEQYTTEVMKEIRSVLYEMIKNAEYATPKERGFMAEFYQGEKGVLFGTRQDENFLNSDQILLLQQRCTVPITKEDTCNQGMDIISGFADGLHINKKQKLIVISKLVEKLK